MAANKAVKQFRYPRELREQFENTGDIIFGDGHHVTAREIWRFMTEDAPQRWPGAFDIIPFNVGHVSEDSGFLSGIKRQYLAFTLRDRLDEAKKKGIPIIMGQGGQSFEPYFAAGGLGMRPAWIGQWARDQDDGLDLRQADFKRNGYLEQGRREISVDTCNLVASHHIVRNKIVDVDLVAPYLCLRCSDMAYLTESHRSGDVQKKTPLQLIDFPSNHNGTREWSVKYVAAGLRRLTEKISRLSGKHTTDEDLREVIIKFNTLRSLAREISHLCWEAEIPPLNSADFRGLAGMGNEPYLDVDASICVLLEAKEEVLRRIAQSVRGFGVAQNPARLFVCGSCVTANPYLVDMAGGIVVSHDDGWSETVTDVAVEGDPYVNLAKAILAYPYERSTKERAEWTVEQVKQSRAEGLIFIYNWGCNYQSAPARMLTDIVNEKAGIPSSHIGSSELGRSESVAQFHNRVEAFIEMLRLRKGFTQRISA